LPIFQEQLESSKQKGRGLRGRCIKDQPSRSRDKDEVEEEEVKTEDEVEGCEDARGSGENLNEANYTEREVRDQDEEQRQAKVIPKERIRRKPKT
jgi:hypothetical protein